ncbi:hypothetical protein DSAG12_00221 [Promethearchaeum syntrophicum]|uniref:Uncharacterized protein n=1 Tax=Promethearchaeum syntrophicum TaxID=2594042 RepID=A0A5B9D5L0_9ARCH|nr:hypothetical protein [Candidatus Prometheoarchaeum syntrophicum]QEE14408.1 hypothetical protein DSAG12_00221 [Candidatus Prometheoarchaeum syntrophicum]
MSINGTDWAWFWWTVMVIISIVNLVVCAVVYQKTRIPKDATNTSYRKRMRIMGVIFTIVAAYRTVFVSRYDPQLAWFDSIANSSLLIRVFAAAAELSFSGLIAFAMLQFNIDLPAGNPDQSSKFKTFITTKTPYILIICIFLAQFFAFGGVIFKFDLFWAIEETLWSVGFIAILPLSIIQLRRVLSLKDKEKLKRLQMLKLSAIVIATWCVIYCSYGLFFHIFGLWESAIIEIKTGFPSIGSNAITDAFMIVNETKVYSDWGFGFLLWHSAYFSVCVWISIFLMQAPRSRETPKKYNSKLILITLAIIILTLVTLIILIT